MFERLTERARHSLVLAQEEARLLNHRCIGTEHLLLGLMKEQDGIAAQALSHLDLSVETVRLKVEEVVQLVATGPSGSPPFTPRAKKVLELALREALRRGHSHIGTEHILLGLAREGEGTGANVLVSLIGDLGRVRVEVIKILSENRSENASSWMSQLHDAPVAGQPPDNAYAAEADIRAAFAGSSAESEDGISVLTVEGGGTLGPILTALKRRLGGSATQGTNVFTSVDEIVFTDPTHAVVGFSRVCTEFG